MSPQTSPIDELMAQARASIQQFATSPGMQRLTSGALSPGHYAEYLKQVYYHTRENPQLQALATAYFRGEQRGVVRRFFSHAAAEIGHERMALDDLAVLGEDIREIPYRNPLPATTALISFPFYQIRSLNPVGYLGYLYFLEALPTTSGPGYMQLLAGMGVPQDAMSFLKAHSEVDQVHVRHMEYYADQLLTTRHALASALYAVRVTADLYAKMVEAAFAQADAPVDYGLATTELPSYDDEPLWDDESTYAAPTRETRSRTTRQVPTYATEERETPAKSARMRRLDAPPVPTAERTVKREA